MTANIRAGRLSDLDSLIALEGGFEPGERISPRSWRRFLAQTGKVWVADMRGEIAGAAVILTRKGSRRARLYSLATDPIFRGRGVAKSLIGAIETDLQRRGADLLGLEVRTDNAAAIALYMRLGFQTCGQRAGYYSDGMNAILMEKSLIPHEGLR